MGPHPALVLRVALGRLGQSPLGVDRGRPFRQLRAILLALPLDLAHRIEYALPVSAHLVPVLEPCAPPEAPSALPPAATQCEGSRRRSLPTGPARPPAVPAAPAGSQPAPSARPAAVGGELTRLRAEHSGRQLRPQRAAGQPAAAAGIVCDHAA
eukprot:7385536-Prymnesium_polylepis.1